MSNIQRKSPYVSDHSKHSDPPSPMYHTLPRGKDSMFRKQETPCWEQKIWYFFKYQKTLTNLRAQSYGRSPCKIMLEIKNEQNYSQSRKEWGRERENMSWYRANSSHEISFLESYTSRCIGLMRLTLERCIEHIRHPVPVRSGKKITSEGLTTHFVFEPDFSIYWFFRGL